MISSSSSATDTCSGICVTDILLMRGGSLWPKFIDLVTRLQLSLMRDGHRKDLVLFFYLPTSKDWLKIYRSCVPFAAEIMPLLNLCLYQ